MERRDKSSTTARRASTGSSKGYSRRSAPQYSTSSIKQHSIKRTHHRHHRPEPWFQRSETNMSWPTPADVMHGLDYAKLMYAQTQNQPANTRSSSMWKSSTSGTKT